MPDRAPGLRGRRVVVRPFRPDEVETLWAAYNEPEQWEGHINPGFVSWRTVQKDVDTSGEFEEGDMALAVEADGRLVGDVAARTLGLPPDAYELGIGLFDPKDRGNGYGTEAVALLADYLFGTRGARRLQATTSIANGAMCAALEKLGFVREGELREFYPTETGRDAAMYALTREDWEKKRNGWT